MSQLPIFEPQSSWKPPRLSELPSWANAKRIAIDTETRDPHLRELGIGCRRDGYIVGVSFAIEDGPCFYLPVRHMGEDNLDATAVFNYLRDQAAVFKGDLVGANISYDLDYLASASVHFRPRYFRDVQIADPLINELHDSYSLENIARRYNLSGKDENALREAAHMYKVDPKRGLWQLPAKFVGAYAEQDVRLPLQILRRQERIIDEEDLWDIYNLESKVTPVLVRMSQRGVRIDLQQLQKVEDWSLAEETKALLEIKNQTGKTIPIGGVWEAKALKPVLESVGIMVGETATGKPSIDKKILADANHPVAKAIAWARKVNKLRTTFAESVRRHMVNGRIHCTYRQIAQEKEEGGVGGGRYGRLSCVNPNLQQQPSRDEFAAMWRSIYVPEEGAIWASNDYSQQEPRWTTHFAAKLQLPGGVEAAAAYHNDPKIDHHQFMADITGLPRKRAKDVFLGLCYGEGGAKLCRDLNLPTRWAVSVGIDRNILYFKEKEDALKEARRHEKKFVWEAAGEEGQAILDKFDQRAPFVRLLAKEAQKAANKRGRIRTVLGRNLHFPQKKDGSFDWTHKALNRLIQGSSADQTKMAMVLLEENVPEFWMQLQVHDEVDASVENGAVARKAAEVMRDCVPALIPFRVDVELGPSWGQIA